jgi:hypothetical protein
MWARAILEVCVRVTAAALLTPVRLRCSAGDGFASTYFHVADPVIALLALRIRLELSELELYEKRHSQRLYVRCRDVGTHAHSVRVAG